MAISIDYVLAGEVADTFLEGCVPVGHEGAVDIQYALAIQHGVVGYTEAGFGS